MVAALVAGGVIVALVMALVNRAEPAGPPDESALDAALAAAAAALLVVAAVLCTLRWRVSGRTTALWIASTLLLAATTLLCIDVLPLVVEYDGLLGTVSAALLVGSLLAASCAAFGPEVDTAVGVREVAVLLAVACLGIFAAFWVAGIELVSNRSQHGSWTGLTAPLSLGWAVLAVVLFVRARHRGTSTMTWFSLLLASFALLHAWHSVKMASDQRMAEGHAAPLVIGASLVLFGAISDLHGLYTRMQPDAAAGVDSRRSGDRADAAARAHRARNALMAVDGTTQLLGRYHETLAPETRASLVEGVESELAILRALIDSHIDGQALHPEGGTTQSSS